MNTTTEQPPSSNDSSLAGHLPPGQVKTALPEPSSEARLAYDRRLQRIMDCVALKQPDRMPIVFHTNLWLAKYGGMTMKDSMYDYDRATAVIEQACVEFEPELMSPLMDMMPIGRILEAAEFKQLEWPGHGVGDNQPFQYLDREYMTANEYDDFLLDPTGYYLGKYLPRVAGVFDGLQPLAGLAGNIYIGLAYLPVIFSLPPVRQAMAKLAAAGEGVMELVGRTKALEHRLKCLGFPYGKTIFSSAPYDFVADYMRGAKGMMTDLYRHRKKLPEVFEKVKQLTLRTTIARARMTDSQFVIIPIHWAPDAFMSQKQFEEFWWPSFRELMIGLIDAGLTPVPLWEADCTKRLEVIRDIPAGKCIYWFERTDLVKAYEILGDVVALRGNVSGSTLNMGTTEDVDAEVKRLVDNIWNKGGHLILDTAFGIPDEAPVENVRAMFAAARKYA